MTNDILVVKSGGGAGNSFETVLDDLAELWQSGQRWVYLHGGSERANEVSEQLGHPPQFITSKSGFESRRTDRRTALTLAMVYAGEINTEVVEGLQRRGVNAVGLSGVDGRLLVGKRKAAIRAVQDGKTVMIRDDYTGTIKEVNDALLRMLLDNGYAPVVSIPAISHDHELINVDGDRAAAAVAGAVQAEHLILLTGAEGLCRDFSDKNSLISELSFDELETAMTEYAEGRMRIKMLAAQEALENGARRVSIAGSSHAQPLKNVLENQGGTTISRTQSTGSDNVASG